MYMGGSGDPAPIDEGFRKCVAYVCADTKPDGRTKVRAPIGTAFLAGVAEDGPDGHDADTGKTNFSGAFLVTARHVVDGGEYLGNLCIRFNDVSGGTRDAPFPRERWRLHPTADVAVMPFEPEEWIDCAVVPTTLMISESYAAEQPLLGARTFLVGLFTPYPGRERNQPIVRFGHLAMMGQEEIEFATTCEGQRYSFTMKAHLVDAQSWGGQSGSPAFVSHSEFVAGGQRMAIVAPARPMLLGLVSGHYPIRAEVPIRNEASSSLDLNAGIAVVVPAARILDLILPPSGPVELPVEAS